MGRYADVIRQRLRYHAVRISGRPSEQITRRLALTDLDAAWETAVRGYASGPAQARVGWTEAVQQVAERLIDALPLRPLERGQLLAQYRDRVSTPPAARPPGRPAARTYAAFGGQYTLSELARDPRCVVTYPTLRTRVAGGWSVEEAATTPGRRGPATSS